MDDREAGSLNAASHDATPSSSANTRFTSTTTTAEDLLKSQTVGLVQLSDFRKRRAEVLEQQSRDVLELRSGGATPESGRSRASTPAVSTAKPNPLKKKRKAHAKGKLSFGLNDEDDEAHGAGINVLSTTNSGSATPVSRSNSPGVAGSDDTVPSDTNIDSSVVKRKLGPNSTIAFVPRAKTKNALLKEAQTREQLRKEFLVMQEIVKATEVVIPFVFHDGTNIPGGKCRIKKGEHVWLFLDRARKVGAELGVGGGDRGRREWARVSVDDLMLVRHDIIIPHHHDFYYFLISKTTTYEGGPLFGYSAEPTSASPSKGVSTEDVEDLSSYDPLAKPSKRPATDRVAFLDEELEGTDDDPAVTKVVDRRWYERNKHIYPASTWEEFESTKDYAKTTRKDAEGNAFFFS